MMHFRVLGPHCRLFASLYNHGWPIDTSNRRWLTRNYNTKSTYTTCSLVRAIQPSWVAASICLNVSPQPTCRPLNQAPPTVILVVPTR